MDGQLRAKEKTPMRYRLAIASYQAILFALMPLVWRYFLRRAKKDPAYGEHWDERRGEQSADRADVWVHAVSLGELRSAEPCIRAILNEGASIIITHATPAGRRGSYKLFEKDISEGRVQVAYAPLDRIIFWKQFFRAKCPKVGLVFEIEFWPGMVEAARSSGVDLWFANSQVPSKTYPRARRVRALLGSHPVQRARGVLAKSERMAERLRALGGSDVRSVGETRFDIPPPQEHLEAAKHLKSSRPSRRIVTFASVVEGEEELYLEAARKLLKSIQGSLIVWVPRASETFESTFDLLVSAGLGVAKRSDVLDDSLTLTGALDGVEVLVGDSYGEMFFYLSLADAVSVGGGFLESGAHNVIEPLALGKPVATGPQIWTIEYPAVEAIEAGVLEVCQSAENLAETLEDLIGRDAAAAVKFHQDNAGASIEIAELAMNTVRRVS